MRRLPPFLAALAIVLVACLLPAAPALAAKDIDYHRLPQKKLLKLAEAGDREAIWRMQLSSYFDYKKKQTVTRSLEERLPWMRKGAELGDYRLQFILAHHLLLPPPGTAPDPAAAEPLLVAGLAGARQLEGRDFLAGQLLGEGPKMLARARQLQKVPALLAEGSPAALFEAAQAYVPIKLATWPEQPLGDAAEHRRLVELAAQQGHLEAILQMANNSPTREVGMKWRRLAAERGDVASMESMAAEMAMQGKKAESQDWHRRAAEAGSSNSAYWYAWNLQSTGAKAEAIRWYEMAAGKGHKEAQAQLAALVDPYVVRLAEAAGKGDGVAALELGGYYRKKGDPERARSWYSRADGLGNLEGTYQYALLLKELASRDWHMQKAAQGGHTGARAWLANDAQRGQRALQQAAQQMEADKRQAFVARIDREGSTDKLEVEYYCQYGGRRCNELRGVAHRAEQGRNAQVQSDNMRRIQDVDSSKGDSDAAARARSECMRRKTESIQRSTYGQQDWKFTGECP